MTEVGDKYRAGQAADFDRYDIPADARVRTITLGIYDSADALTEDQQSLFSVSAMTAAEHALERAIEQVEDQGLRAHLVLAESLLSVAGYITEQAREIKGWTSTEDSKVEKVYQSVKTMVRETAMTGMPEEAREKVDAISEAIRLRLNTGDGPVEKVVREEIAKAGGMPGIDTIQVNDTEIDLTTDQKDEPTGMYL